ncbi:hypothetical protein PNOK_0732000 [Pyrrhoderma noxium]|uniref:Uncharacterized protein n=1 Tax=Pyrrhoderma noxium TaxID=2282107 RepID=A0A286UCG7_9AGAM|nr:hypothetical protein PNOK_0732000 [Pyrrhoderma noxium]
MRLCSSLPCFLDSRNSPPIAPRQEDPLQLPLIHTQLLFRDVILMSGHTVEQSGKIVQLGQSFSGVSTSRRDSSFSASLSSRTLGRLIPPVIDYLPPLAPTSDSFSVEDKRSELIRESLIEFKQVNRENSALLLPHNPTRDVPGGRALKYSKKSFVDSGDILPERDLRRIAFDSP